MAFFLKKRFICIKSMNVQANDEKYGIINDGDKNGWNIINS